MPKLKALLKERGLRLEAQRELVARLQEGETESVFNMCDCVNVAVADMSTNFAYLHMLSVSRLVDSDFRSD